MCGQGSPAEIKVLLEQFRQALMSADEETVLSMKKKFPESTLRIWKDELLDELTGQYVNGETPFCQLTAVAQAARALREQTAAPVACCGGIAGNTSTAGRDHMLMMLEAWGVPCMDLGLDAAPLAFADAIEQHNLQFAVCMAFSQRETESVLQLDEIARRRGLRGRFSLLLCGADITQKEELPLDCPEHRVAPAARWIAKKWKS